MFKNRLNSKIKVTKSAYFYQWKGLVLRKIVAAFRGMHVSPAKHSFASVTDGQTDDGQSDPYVSLCFAGDRRHKNAYEGFKS